MDKKADEPPLDSWLTSFSPYDDIPFGSCHWSNEITLVANDINPNNEHSVGVWKDTCQSFNPCQHAAADWLEGPIDVSQMTRAGHESIINHIHYENKNWKQGCSVNNDRCRALCVVSSATLLWPWMPQIGATLWRTHRTARTRMVSSTTWI